MKTNTCIRRIRRRGITSAMAMLYLTLFATLSLGFYATVTTSVQIAKNDQRTAKALLAAESGVQFMRYHLANVNISPTSGDPMGELCNDLKARLEGSTNLGGNHITLTNNTISIPGETGSYIKTNAADNSGFSASITDHGGNIVCTVMGRAGLTATSTAAKGVCLDFRRQPNTANVFDYAVASKGRVMMLKGALSGVTGISDNSVASIMSSKTASGAMTVSGGSIGGDINVLFSKSYASVTGGSVGGTSNISSILATHTHALPTAPSWPNFDATVFEPYATKMYTGATNGTFKNVKIPPNSNPKFAGNVIIQGVMYVQSPNTITFQGNTTLQGFIVVEDKNTVADNVITVSGNLSQGILPSGPEFDPVRTTTGIAFIAPTTAMVMSGSVDSQVRGNMILGTFANTGSADLQIDQGTLLTLDDTVSSTAVFNAKTVKWTGTGKNNQPTQGVSYDTKYVPVAGSYRELN